MSFWLSLSKQCPPTRTLFSSAPTPTPIPSSPAEKQKPSRKNARRVNSATNSQAPAKMLAHTCVPFAAVSHRGQGGEESGARLLPHFFCAAFYAKNTSKCFRQLFGLICPLRAAIFCCIAPQKWCESTYTCFRFSFSHACERLNHQHAYFFLPTKPRISLGSVPDPPYSNYY